MKNPSDHNRRTFLFVVKLAIREVQLAGLAPEPNESWVGQVARNLVGSWDGFLRGMRILTFWGDVLGLPLASLGLGFLYVPWQPLSHWPQPQHEKQP